MICSPDFSEIVVREYQDENTPGVGRKEILSSLKRSFPKPTTGKKMQPQRPEVSSSTETFPEAVPRINSTDAISFHATT
jgi:hypothetical protein